MSAADEARERAARLRRVLDECEAILADKDADPERREAAQRWQDRLGGLGPLSEGAYGMGASLAHAPRHTSGGGNAMRAQMVYDGYGDV